MNVLVDSSVWVAYFRGTGDQGELEWLIEENAIVVNDLILAELIPPLLVRSEKKLITLLRTIENIPLAPDWGGIIHLQATCIKHGIHKVGIPDLIISQHAIQNKLALFSLDKHFALLGKHIAITLY